MYDEMFKGKRIDGKAFKILFLTELDRLNGKMALKDLFCLLENRQIFARNFSFRNQVLEEVLGSSFRSTF